MELLKVKNTKYLGFNVAAKNCSFSVTLGGLSIKDNRAIDARNNKIKISKLATKLIDCNTCLDYRLRIKQVYFFKQILTRSIKITCTKQRCIMYSG